LFFEVVSLLWTLKFWLRCVTLPISSIWLKVSWARAVNNEQ
jgi:hypothetical protein